MTKPTDQSRLVGGRYVLEKLIGEGGTGEVWRAKHVTLQSPVAIKLLHGSAAFREITRKRFLTEARVAAQLNTRHAVKVFDFGVTEQGRPYLIMELLDGETLADRLLRKGKLTPYATARILRLAARALDNAHALGVVHRDFKPENIFLVRSEEGNDDVKVVDFGVAKLVGDLEEGEPEEATSLSSRRMERALFAFTKTGKSVGTPVYMAPEQARGETDVGPSVDIWAMGVVAYECLTGHRPFVANDIESLFDRISSCTHYLAHTLNPDLSETFEAWFDVACNPKPSGRFENASVAAMALVDALGIQSSSLSDGEAALSTTPNAGSLAGDRTPPTGSTLRDPESIPLGTTTSPSMWSLQPTPTGKRVMMGAAVAIFAVVMASLTWWQWYGKSRSRTASAAAAPSAAVVSDAPPTEPSATSDPSISASSSASQNTGDPEPVPLEGRRDPPSAGLSTTSPQPKKPTSTPSAPTTPTATATPTPTAPAPAPTTQPTPASPFELPELGL